jgi:uncharacterized protein YcbX
LRFIFAVKSLRAVSMSEAELDEQGFVGDRRFMLVYPAPLPAWKDKFGPKDSTHRFLTQRQCPSLATVGATLDKSKNNLILEYKKKRTQIPLQPPSPKQSYRAGIWDDQVVVDDMGDEAAKFLQQIVSTDGDAKASGSLYQSIRLVSHSQPDRNTDPKFTPTYAKTWLGTSPPVSLTDGFPILIACQASLNALNDELVKQGKEKIPMSRFRPNIVITGTQAFEEDKWKVIAIGEQLFAIVKACPRCKQSCTDQETGRVHSEPVETMKNFRALGDKREDVFFAQNAIPLGQTGSVQVGDSVRVLQTGDPVYC